MKHVILTLLLVLTTAVTVQAQTEHRSDSIRGGKANHVPEAAPVKGMEKIQEYVSPDKGSAGMNANDMPQMPHFDYSLDNKPSQEMQPSHNNPYNGNFSTGGYMLLDRNSYLSGGYAYSAYPLMGSVRSSSLFYTRELNSHLSITGGFYGAKYNLGNTGQFMMVGGNMIQNGVFNDWGLKGAFEWRVNSWLSFHGFGTYSLNNPHYSLSMNPYLENTNYGGTVRIMFNKHIGVEGGVVREFNPWTGKWKTYPVINPIIKFGE